MSQSMVEDLFRLSKSIIISLDAKVSHHFKDMCCFNEEVDNMNTKNNQRYQDTEKLIQDTLLSLAQEIEIHKVTVRAICEAAHINRSSFYLHYLDIHDLIFKMGRKMMKEVG